MFNWIFDLFHKDDKKQDSKPETKILDKLSAENQLHPRKPGDITESKEDDLDTKQSRERLLSQHKRGLAILKQRVAVYGGTSTPLELLVQIEDIEKIVARLEQVIQDDVSEDQWQRVMGSFGLRTTPSSATTIDNIQKLRQKIIQSLNFYPETLRKLSAEMEHMPVEAKTGAAHLLGQAEQEFLGWTKEWNTLNAQSEPPAIAIKELTYGILNTEHKLSILRERLAYRRNLNLLEQQLAMQQMALPKDKLQEILSPAINEATEKIHSLKAKSRLNAHEQKILEIYQHNLELHEQILAGERLYAPLSLLNNITSQEKNLKRIDTRLVQLGVS